MLGLRGCFGGDAEILQSGGKPRQSTKKRRHVRHEWSAILKNSMSGNRKNETKGAKAEAPAAEYARRIAELRLVAARLAKSDELYGRVKVGLLAVGTVAAVGAVLYHRFSAYWVIVPVAAFVYFVVAHERLLRQVRRTGRVMAFYERGMARLENRWQGAGQSGERFLEPRHPYARDLDIFGRGSIFELLCAARTQAGEETLAAWLLGPAAPEIVRERNSAVTELCGRLELREDLANLGQDLQSGVQPEALAKWGEGFADPRTMVKKGARATTASANGDASATATTYAPLPAFSTSLRVVALALSCVWLAGLVAWIGGSIHWLIVGASLAGFALTFRYLKNIQEQVGAVERSAKDLALLAGVLGRLERETFSAPLLVALRGRLQGDGVAASVCVAKLNKLIELLDSRRNQVVALIDPFIMWSLQLTFAIVAWRREHGPSIRRWLAAVGELEALSDFAGYAYEHPGDVFPEFVEARGSDGKWAACFDAEGFVHPLLPEGRAVRNDLKLDDALRLIVISGPNMAGKSTFLRGVGVNAVLAQAGAPVRARSLRMSRLTVAASVCILDSLEGGISRFYAEITRLKLIVDLTNEDLPVLFLLDELLSGTNSHDRRIGAEAIVRSLLERGAAGLLTTHDLALAEIATALEARASNAHFEDHLEDGKLCFDHRLSDGIVKSSNALELMRSIGLKI